MTKSDGPRRITGRLTTGTDPSVAPTPYPAELEHQEQLPDATMVTVRAIRPEDGPALSALVARSTPEDIRLRFFMPIRQLSPEMEARLSHIDYAREMAFVATDPASPSGEILGVGRVMADANDDRAEYALMVRSDLKGRGIGYALLRDLIADAPRRGIRTIFGEVLRENRTMLQMVRELGFTIGAGDDSSLVKVSIDVPAAKPALPDTDAVAV